GHLAQLPLQRCRHPRRHDAGARPRLECHHLNGRIIHFRQRRDGQLAVCDQSGEEDCAQDQRRGNRPHDEWLRDVHEDAPVGLTETTAPSRRPSKPSTTTWSPADTPEVMAVSRSAEFPVTTCWRLTLPSGVTTNTYADSFSWRTATLRTHPVSPHSP